MNAFHKQNDWFSRRFRSALVVGMTSVSMTVASLDEVNAGWLSLPSTKKSDDNAERNSSVSSGGQIRKLMAEAKAQEKLGNLDRAIKLADRAHRLAESTSNMTKLAQDVSPAATSRLADNLRLKKTELTVKRTGGASQREKTPVAESKDSKEAKDPKSRPGAAEIPSAASRKKAIAPEATASSDLRPSTKESKSPPPATPPKSKSSSLTASKIASKPSNPDFKVETKRAAADKAALDSALSKFAVDDAIDSKVVATKHRENKPPAAKASFDFDEDFSEIRQPPILPSPTVVSKKVQKLELNSVAISRQMKLRPLYVSPDDFGSIILAAATEASDEFDVEATNDVVSTSEDLADSSLESDRKVTFATDEELPTTLEKPAKSMPDLRSGEKWTKLQSSQIERSTEEFPVDKVLEFKLRMDSVTAFEPGAVRPTTTKAVEEDQPLEKKPEENRTVKLRKRPKRIQELPIQTNDSLTTATNESVSTRPIHQSVIVKTAMIQWRPAKETTPTQIPAMERIHPKADVSTYDLRQSVNQNTPAMSTALSAPMNTSELMPPNGRNMPASAERSRPNSSLPVGSAASDTRSATLKLRGSLWDHATAPSIEGYSGSIEGSAKALEAPSVMLGLAPMPPASAEVEQTSFDSSDGLFDRYRRSQSNIEHASRTDRLEAPGASASPTEELSRSSVSPEVGSRRSYSSKVIQPAADLAEKTRGELANGPIERLALLLGVPVSNASSIVLAAGLTLLFGGLWMVRAAVGWKNN